MIQVNFLRTASFPPCGFLVSILSDKKVKAMKRLSSECVFESVSRVSSCRRTLVRSSFLSQNLFWRGVKHKSSACPLPIGTLLSFLNCY